MDEYFDPWAIICPDRSKAGDPILLQAWYDGFKRKAQLQAAELELLRKNSPHISDAPSRNS